MNHWSYEQEDSGKFEQPLSLQDYEFHLGLCQRVMVRQPYTDDQPYQPSLPFLEEMTAQLHKSSFANAKWLREFEERSKKLDQLLEQIQANNLDEHNHDLSTQHSSKSQDIDSLYAHDDFVMHSSGVEREDNVPLDHFVNNVHHNFKFKEDGNREENNVLPGNGLGDCDVVLSWSNKGVDKEAGGEENVPSGEQVLDGHCEVTLEPRQKAADRNKKKKKKKQGLKSEVFDIFKGADVNFPLLDLISQVPAYAEFVKNLCMHKKKIHDDEKFVLKEEVSAIIQGRMSSDINDPTSFVVGCTIGEQLFKRATKPQNASDDGATLSSDEVHYCRLVA